VSEQTVSVRPDQRQQIGATSKLWNLKQRQSRFALFMVLPTAIMMILFIGYPVVYSFLLTFSTFSVREVGWFAAGLSNYEQVLNDRQFSSALQFTLLYTVVYVPLSMILGLLVGVLLQQIKVGAVFFRSILFLPTVIPIAMGLLMFQWVFEPNNGIFNYLLANVLGRPDLTHNWLGSIDSAFQTIVAITLWGFGPWILLLAALLSIPKDFYEAARVDGANPVQEFLFITIPQMHNALVVVTTLQIIKALKIFVPIYMLTGGNPAGTTRSLYFLVFQKVNQGQNWYTYATTVGWVFTIIIVAITLGTMFFMRFRRAE
jgi:ABC-type sugar transport system permease subunit